jgi:hypothetical protein
MSASSAKVRESEREEIQLQSSEMELITEKTLAQN